MAKHGSVSYSLKPDDPSNTREDGKWQSVYIAVGWDQRPTKDGRDRSGSNFKDLSFSRRELQGDDWVTIRPTSHIIEWEDGLVTDLSGKYLTYALEPGKAKASHVESSSNANEFADD